MGSESSNFSAAAFNFAFKIVASREPSAGPFIDFVLARARSFGPPGLFEIVSGGFLGISKVSFGILGPSSNKSFTSLG